MPYRPAPGHTPCSLASLADDGITAVEIRCEGHRCYHQVTLPVSRLYELGFRPESPGNAVKPEAEPHPGEPIFRKTVNSALIGAAENGRSPIRPGAWASAVPAAPRRSA